MRHGVVVEKIVAVQFIRNLNTVRHLPGHGIRYNDVRSNIRNGVACIFGEFGNSFIHFRLFRIVRRLNERVHCSTKQTFCFIVLFKLQTCIRLAVHVCDFLVLVGTVCIVERVFPTGFSYCIIRTGTLVVPLLCVVEIGDNIGGIYAVAQHHTGDRDPFQYRLLACVFQPDRIFQRCSALLCQIQNDISDKSGGIVYDVVYLER